MTEARTGPTVAMILAAGRGERMRPLTDSCPKPLLEAGGRPLIEYTIEALAAAGIRRIVINHAYRGEQIVSRLGDGRRWGVAIRYSAEPEGMLETAGGIRRALPLLGQRPFVVVNGDVWTDFPFATLRLPPGRQAHLVLVANPAFHREGDFVLCRGRVAVAGPGHRATFSGIGLYAPELFARLPTGHCRLGPLLQKAAGEDRVSGEFYSGCWHDIGTPERLAELRRKLDNAVDVEPP